MFVIFWLGFNMNALHAENNGYRIINCITATKYK